MSGTRASRPELDKMLDHLRKGDELVIWKLDRLGRAGSLTRLDVLSTHMALLYEIRPTAPRGL